MDIQKNISDFLLSYDKLHFPGLGTVKKIRTEAGMKRGEMRPPGVRLVFTPEESAEEKNIFPDYLAEKENISPEEAQQRLLELIDDIKFAFNKGEAYTIEGVCSLYLDEDNNIKLDQTNDFIGDPDLYGLESFDLEELKEEEKAEEKAEKVEKEESTEESEFYSEKMGWVLREDQDMHKFEETYVTGNYRSGQADQEARQKDENVEKEKNEEKEVTPAYQEPPPPPPVPPYPQETATEMRKPGRRKRINIGLTITGIAILVIAAVIIIPLKTDIFNNDINFDDIFGSSEEMEVNDDFSEIEDEEFNFDEMVDGLEKDLDSASEMGHALDIEEEKATRDEDVEDTPVATDEYVEYHIIAGSFRDYENAKELQQELTLQGYPSLLIEPGGGIYRVSAISFRDKVTALNKLVEFREETGMKTAWLMNLE